MVVRMLSLDCYSGTNAFSMRLWRLAHVWTAYRSKDFFMLSLLLLSFFGSSEKGGRGGDYRFLSLEKIQFAQ